MGSTLKVGILGHVGNQNLGDEAIIAAVIQNVKQRYPHASIVCFTINPEDTAERHGIEAYPLRSDVATSPAMQTQTKRAEASGARRFKAVVKSIPVLSAILRFGWDVARWIWRAAKDLSFTVRSMGRVRGVDVIIIAGSGQLCDHTGGPFGFPLTLLRWTVLAKLAGARVAYFSVGAGPLTHRLSRLFVRIALNLADYHSYRDDTSKDLIESIGVAGPNFVVPDLAYSLHVEATDVRRNAGNPVVGINPIPFFDERYWHKVDASKYDAYITKLARFTSWLVRNEYPVVLFPTQLRIDTLVVEDILRRMHELGDSALAGIVQEAKVEGLSSLTAAINGLDVVIATRYHGVLLSYLMGKPVVGLAYQPKAADLMAMVGQGDCVLDAADFETRDLIESFERLLKTKTSRVTQITSGVERNRRAVEQQYEWLTKNFPVAQPMTATTPAVVVPADTQRVGVGR